MECGERNVENDTYPAPLLRTPQLDLTPSSPILARAELEGTEVFARELAVTVPDDWPPELFDRDALVYFLEWMENGDAWERSWWTYYYYILCEEPRVVVGVGGFKGPPSSDGVVEIGYSVIPAYQRRGLATEAAAALVEHAFSFQAIDCVTAQTFPNLTPSIGVLRKIGFALKGPGSEHGTILFALSRRDWMKDAEQPATDNRQRSQP